MSALVETMSFVGKTPWHGIGTQMTEDADIKTAMEKSGLDWTVSKEQLQFSHGDQCFEYPDRFAIVRSSDNSVLGDCGPNYQLLQNHKAFEWFTPFIESKDASIHTCGALKGGSIIWILAKINKDPLEIRPNDTVDKYLLLSHSFDGTLSVRVSFTPVRVVCWNTLSMSLRDNLSKKVRIRHSSNMHDNLALVQETVNLAEQSFDVTAEKYRALQNKGVNQNDLKNYFRQVFEVEENPSTRTINQLAELTGLFESGRGNQGKTYWDAFNAVTEYLTWNSGNRVDSRFNSLWFGSNQTRNVRALDLAVSLSS